MNTYVTNIKLNGVDIYNYFEGALYDNPASFDAALSIITSLKSYLSNPEENPLNIFCKGTSKDRIKTLKKWKEINESEELQFGSYVNPFPKKESDQDVISNVIEMLYDTADLVGINADEKGLYVNYNYITITPTDEMPFIKPNKPKTIGDELAACLSLNSTDSMEEYFIPMNLLDEFLEHTYPGCYWKDENGAWKERPIGALEYKGQMYKVTWR